MDIVAKATSEPASQAPRAIAYAGAAVFLVAAAWYALVVTAVTVDAEPTFSPGQPFSERLEIFYDWFGTTVGQEVFYGSISTFAVLCLGATALFVGRRLAAEGPVAALGAQGIVAGVVLWAVGSVMQLGGHAAVARMAAGETSLEVVHSVKVTIDTVNDAFQLAAVLLLGAGLLGFAALGLRRGSEWLGWARCTLAVGLVILALAGAYAARAYDVVDLLLVVGGVVALPVWVAWSGRLLAR